MDWTDYNIKNMNISIRESGYNIEIMFETEQGTSFMIVNSREGEEFWNLLKLTQEKDNERNTANND
ncbi:MAG: hypothetical protein J6S85_01965 [Methanobrevibacter sp.]|nr:hypothetical protein [Methanobrevibacter sp.]